MYVTGSDITCMVMCVHCVYYIVLDIKGALQEMVTDVIIWGNVLNILSVSWYAW